MLPERKSLAVGSVVVDDEGLDFNPLRGSLGNSSDGGPADLTSLRFGIKAMTALSAVEIELPLDDVVVVVVVVVELSPLSLLLLLVVVVAEDVPSSLADGVLFVCVSLEDAAVLAAANDRRLLLGGVSESSSRFECILVTGEGCTGLKCTTINSALYRLPLRSPLTCYPLQKKGRKGESPDVTDVGAISARQHIALPGLPLTATTDPTVNQHHQAKMRTKLFLSAVNGNA